MDQFISRFPAIADDDLMLCMEHGVAYQADMSTPVPYDGAYFDKYVGYEGQEIALRLNEGRAAIVNHHVGPDCSVVDVGIGSGEFIKSRDRTYGFDVNAKAVDWLKARFKFVTIWDAFQGFSFWDVLEHVETPRDYFDRMPFDMDVHVFVSIPIFRDLTRIRESKHYRPNEHFYYFTEAGIVAWMGLHGFEHLETSDFETRAGREDILTFVFRRKAAEEQPFA